MKKLFLLDAYALIFRAYYALIKMPRITQTGFNTSAIFGFVNTLEELIRKENPSHMAVCFDPQGPTFRNEAFREYKAERSATPEDIKLSVPFIKEIVKAYGIPVIEVEGFEADDVIGTIARLAEKQDFVSYMMTPDKDFGQLVSPSILQYKPSYRGQDFELRGEKEVCARYDIQTPRQVIDLLALMGDKIDNIPGCPGVGEKTAIKLIHDFGSVDNLLQNTDSLKGALKKKVEDNTDQIKFSKFLATIRTDVPVGVTPDELRRQDVDRDKLFAIFNELEFKTLAQRVARRLDEENSFKESSKSPDSTQTPTAPSLFDSFDFDDNSGQQPDSVHPDSMETRFAADYSVISDIQQLEELQNQLLPDSRCAVFLLAIGENDAMAKWIGTAIAPQAGKAAFIPVDFKEGTAAVLDLLARGDILKISINSKRDFVIAQRYRHDSVPALNNFFDLSLAHYLIQPEMRHGIDALAPFYLNISVPPFPVKSNSSRKSAKSDLFSSEEMDAISNWANMQADLSIRLYDPLKKAVENEGMETLLREVELPLVPVLAEMELTGVRIDTAALKEAEIDMTRRLNDLETEIFNLAGEKFNVASPAKVGEILFDRLALDPKAKKTKTGQYSTSEDVLEKLLPKHPIVEKIMKFRALKKLLNTYLTALPAAINPETGRVHTNYNQTVTATGRLSSSAPNLQNIPVRDDDGREIRRAFIAEPGSLFLSADYSQIELRLLADFSHDPIMTDAFIHGKDIHAITAAKIYHKTVEEVSANERRNAKTANFGIVYGISAFGLSSRLGIPRAEAKDIIDNYFETFPTVRKYMSDSVEHAREKGFVETRMGRRRILPDINSRNPVVRGYAERNAINAPLQGTAADIIKVAMIRIFDEMKRRNLKSKMIMQVHDELNFNVPEDEVALMQELVPRIMQEAYSGNVALTASSGVATNWLDAH